MKFIRFENRWINLAAIANVHFDDSPPSPQLWVDYIGDGLIQLEGDRAVLLWAMLSEAIATEAVTEKFASLAATAILSDFGRNGGAADE